MCNGHVVGGCVDEDSEELADFFNAVVKSVGERNRPRRRLDEQRVRNARVTNDERRARVSVSEQSECSVRSSAVEREGE